MNKHKVTKIIYLNKYTKWKSLKEVINNLLNIEFSQSFINNLVEYKDLFYEK